MQPILFPIRQAVLDFEPYSAGLSVEEIQDKFQLGKVVKLASNENPLGASPLVQEAIRRAAPYAFRYAQSGTPKLTKAIAMHFGVAEETIVTGNGSDEVIDMLIRACPTPSEHSVVMSNPSFSLYELQSKLCGVRIKKVPLNKDFSFDFEGLLAAIDDTTSMVFITMPDNPSGYCPSFTDVMKFTQSVPSSCLIILDEAYADFITDSNCKTLIHEVPNISNLVVLRTFSKSFGLAGLRLGFGVMHEHLATCLKSIRPPFSVNIIAEEAGIAALKDMAFREATMSAVHEGVQWVTTALQSLGCVTYPTQANFIMFKLPPKCLLSGSEVFNTLLSLGVIIRPLKSYNLPNHFRVTIGNKEENAFFIELLTKVLLHG